MRIIGEIAHPTCRITLFHWNNRYLIKLEKDYLEQTFKINQFDLASEKDLNTIVSEEFINDAVARFQAMEQSLFKSIENL